MKKRIGTICECKSEILYNHRKCPHCGRKNIKYRKMKFIYISLVLLIFFTAVYLFALSQSEEPELSTVISCLLLIVLTVVCLYLAFADPIRRIIYQPRNCKHKFEQSCWCTKCGFAEHDWDGCKCKSCLRTRNEQHDWDGCKCKRCGATRDERHDWDGDRCKRCRKTRPA